MGYEIITNRKGLKVKRLVCDRCNSHLYYKEIITGLLYCNRCKLPMDKPKPL